MAKLSFNPECENVGGKWHFISETQFSTSVITGGDPFWIKAVARFPMTSVGLGLRIWSCRGRWLLMILHREMLNGVKDLRDMAVWCQNWADSLLLLAFSSIPFSLDCGNMLICLFFCCDGFLCEFTITETEQRKSGWERLKKFWFCSYRNLNHCPLLLIWRAGIAVCDRH